VAAVFRAASLAVAGQPALAFQLLPAALQQPGEQVTYAQRALWRACAHGVYGDTGADLIRQWLAGHVGRPGRRGRDGRGQSVGHGGPAGVQGGGAARVSCARAVARAAAARRAGQPARRRQGAGCAGLLGAGGGHPASPPIRLRPRPRTRAARARANRGAPAPRLRPPSRAAYFPVTELGAVAAALTEEGSRDEITLARRARQLREIIDDRKAASRPSWDAPQDATLALLRADAFGADLRLRKLALDAGLPAGSPRWPAAS